MVKFNYLIIEKCYTDIAKRGESEYYYFYINNSIENALKIRIPTMVD